MADEYLWFKKPEKLEEIDAYLEQLFTFSKDDEWSVQLKKAVQQKWVESMTLSQVPVTAPKK